MLVIAMQLKKPLTKSKRKRKTRKLEKRRRKNQSLCLRCWQIQLVLFQFRYMLVCFGLLSYFGCLHGLCYGLVFAL